MPMVKFTRSASTPARLSDQERARLAVMTDAELEARAAGDDNPPMTDAEWARGRTRWLARKAREAAGLSQSRFAKAYHLNVRTLQGWETGRAAADSALQAYLEVIRLDPERIRQLLLRSEHEAGKAITDPS